MNQRAFNLFTALVAFVLIMLTVLMVSTMTRTEERSIATVSDLQQQSEMQTIADLARGDAFQVFVFQLRRRIADYFNRESTWIPMNPNQEWEDILRDFTCTNFGGSTCSATGYGGVQALANFTGQNIEGLLSEGSVFARYQVSMVFPKGPAQAATEFSRAISEAITTSDPTNPEDELFELVNCNSPTDCEGGAFYLNFRFDKIDDETYEGLPRIQVTDFDITGQELSTGIIPRSRLRVFVPLRVFQALAKAKNIADETVFLPDVAANLAGFQIGTCETTSCNIVVNPQTHQTVSTSTTACAGTDSTGVPTPGTQNMGVPGFSFNPNDTANMISSLTNYTKQYVCALPQAVWHAPESTAGLAPQGISDGECVFLNTNFRLDVASRDIKMRIAGFSNSLNAGSASCVSLQGGNNTYLEIVFEENNPVYQVNNTTPSQYRIRLYPQISSAPTTTLQTCITECANGELGATCGGPHSCVLG